MIYSVKQSALQGDANMQNINEDTELTDEKNGNRVYYSILLEFYGNLLTERQREIIAYSLDEDLSLSEIAELTGITRQGVRDSIGKAEERLSYYEEKLGMYAAFKERRIIGEKLCELLREKTDTRTAISLVRKLCGDQNL